jgi:hypothetical protein
VFICGSIFRDFDMDIDDKFGRIAALRPARRTETSSPGILDAASGGDPLAEILGARVNRNHYGEHVSLQQWYPTPEMCLPDARSLSLLLPQSVDMDSAKIALDPRQWLFLDTETTGLAGGSGTYAFMVGIAWWDAGGLQVEQFFLRDLDEEHSLLLELSERMKQRPVLVTFNGKSFDWPLLETRYRMTRAVPAFSPKLHLDLLRRANSGDCALVPCASRISNGMFWAGASARWTGPAKMTSTLPGFHKCISIISVEDRRNP